METQNNVATTKESKPKNMPLFITKIVVNVIFYILILLLLIFSIMNINAGSGNQGFPNLFGKGFLSVASTSMEGGDSIVESYREEIGWDYSLNKGDMVYVDVASESKINKLQVGDIVTFYDSSLNALNTHRIVWIGYDSNDKATSFILQGDKVLAQGSIYALADPATQNIYLNDRNICQEVQASDIKGVVSGYARGLGSALDNVKKYWLFYFVLPVALFLVFELFMVVKNFMALKNEKNKGALAVERAQLDADKEALKAQLRAELEAEMAKEEKDKKDKQK